MAEINFLITEKGVNQMSWEEYEFFERAQEGEVKLYRLRPVLARFMFMAIIWITHDLGVVASLAQRVIVMYGGYIIEKAPVRELYANPTLPYTLGLLGSLPRLTETTRERLYSIEGQPPVLFQKPNACPFAPRCKWVMEHCWQENPPLMAVGPEHRTACWVDTKTGRHR